MGTHSRQITSEPSYISVLLSYSGMAREVFNFELVMTQATKSEAISLCNLIAWKSEIPYATFLSKCHWDFYAYEKYLLEKS